MRILSYVLAAALGVLGLVFIIGNQGQPLRFIVGIILVVAAGVVIYLTRMRPQVTETTVVQQIDLSGDVNLEGMKCKVCGAPLSKDSIDVKAGAIFVNCDHCGSTYQFEEQPKW